MESENRMRGKGRGGENGRKEGGKQRAIKIEQWREKERDEGGGGG